VPDERGGGGLSEYVFANLISLCEWFSTKHKCSRTSTIYFQTTVALDESLNERSLGHVTIYKAMVVYVATILANILLEAA
jgi:hypothetical protein